jgi:protein TonB
MAPDTDIYGHKDRLGLSLACSALLHAALLGSILLLPAVKGGSDWGNNGEGGSPGDAINARLVSGIPLPSNPQANPENVLASESKGLSQSLPQPETKPDESAIAIPDRNAKLKPPKAKTPAKPTPAREQPREMAKVDNTIPFGSGGPVATATYTNFQSGNTAGGLKFGENGSGTFGNRFGWYTEVVARKVHDAWLSEVNPSVSSAKRVYILFDISRSGAPSNIRVEQSSGIPSLDISATRALQRIDTFGPLPPGYSGSYVSVEFWFDYRR